MVALMATRGSVFLRCSTDNLATTMLSAFEKGVEEYGLPCRVRSDLGGENVNVWEVHVRTAWQ